MPSWSPKLLDFLVLNLMPLSITNMMSPVFLLGILTCLRMFCRLMAMKGSVSGFCAETEEVREHREHIECFLLWASFQKPSTFRRECIFIFVSVFFCFKTISSMAYLFPLMLMCTVNAFTSMWVQCKERMMRSLKWYSFKKNGWSFLRWPKTYERTLIIRKDRCFSFDSSYCGWL